MLEFVESVMKNTGCLSFYCQTEASNECKEYRSQFDTMNYYQNSKSFSKEELATLNVPLDTLEEVMTHYLSETIQKSENQHYIFNSITKIVPEPNER